MLVLRGKPSETGSNGLGEQILDTSLLLPGGTTGPEAVQWCAQAAAAVDLGRWQIEAPAAQPEARVVVQAPSSSWKVIDFSGSPQFTLGFWLLAVLPQCSLWARARSPTSGGSWGEVAYTVILTGIGEGKASRRAGVCLTGGVSQTLTD